jgi:hypothetical protein
MSLMALFIDLLSSKVTKPNPRDLPVSLSTMT